MDMKTGRCAHADIGIETIAKESAGLEKLEEALADGLRETFDAVVEVILRAKGRVIVSGIGKSGHIGRKIAATLASTGTPAQFVHAAEAAHGDLGMITRADVILLLSHSGKTVELQAVMAHAQRFRIPLVAITSNAESPLAQAADHVLLLPKAEEACPLKLAPTTSTTMQLALGDALAMALLAARLDDFSAIRIDAPVETNMVFAWLPRALHEALVEEGVEYYCWREEADRVLARLVCSWHTAEEDIEAFITAIAAHAG